MAAELLKPPDEIVAVAVHDGQRPGELAVGCEQHLHHEIVAGRIALGGRGLDPRRHLGATGVGELIGPATPARVLVVGLGGHQPVAL